VLDVIEHRGEGLTELLVLLESLLLSDLEALGLAGGKIIVMLVGHCCLC